MIVWHNNVDSYVYIYIYIYIYGCECVGYCVLDGRRSQILIFSIIELLHQIVWNFSLCLFWHEDHTKLDLREPAQPEVEGSKDQSRLGRLDSQSSPGRRAG